MITSKDYITKPLQSNQHELLPKDNIIPNSQQVKETVIQPVTNHHTNIYSPIDNSVNDSVINSGNFNYINFKQKVKQKVKKNLKLILSISFIISLTLIYYFFLK